MPATYRLVFGDDRSQPADVAWLWVNSHDWPGWQIEVLTVRPSRPGTSTEEDAWGPEHPRSLIPAGSRIPVCHEIIHGDPVGTIRGLRDRDLLVVGPKGRGVRKALHLGSVSESLVQDPPMPLLIARRGAATTRALVCADGSADSRAAIDALARMPWLGQVDVLAVTVPEARVDVAAAVQSATDALCARAGSFRAEVPAVDELEIVVNPRAELLEAARRWRADLVVLGTRGLSGVAALTAGSIATSLATQCPCSVLMARAAR